MNISKFVDFYLVEGFSDKKQKAYYGISIRLDGKDYIIAFVTKDRYDLLKSSLSD